jgi:hypothetical protein
VIRDPVTVISDSSCACVLVLGAGASALGASAASVRPDTLNKTNVDTK